MKTYLVGGAVRDKLINYPFHERDWVVVGATPDEMLTQGYQQVGKDFPVFLHPQSKEEYALARTERKTAPGYKGFHCFSSPEVTLEEDLKRRDLTINAIAEDDDGTLIDPYGGQHDLQHKLLRHVSDAFIEDPLRVLRVARFSARYAHLGFTVAPETEQLMQKISESDELSALPAERIWKEMQRALNEASPEQFFMTLQRANALEKLMPELSNLPHQTFALLGEATQFENNALGRFALLFFDMDSASAEQACSRLKCPSEYKDIALLISRLGQKYHQPIENADNLLSLIEQLDPFRREQRFERFLQYCELHFEQRRTSEQLRKAYQICNSVSAAQLAKEGLTGKAIAVTLRQRRLAAITEKNIIEEKNK